MQINSITSFNYNKNQYGKILMSKNRNMQNISFQGSKGAGVGAALGPAALAWLGAGALIAAGPLGIAAGMLGACIGGAAVGHAVEETVDSKKKDNKDEE